MRQKSFCAVSSFGDSLGFYDRTIAHKDSILKFRLSVDIAIPGSANS